MTLTFTLPDWLTLFGHFMTLSLLAVGGAITTAPDMQRFLVQEQQWLTDPQFTSSVALAQSAPGPNVLFVGLLGWNVGLNAAGVPGAAFGLVLAMVGMLLPSTTLAYAAASWSHRNRELRAVRAFKQGMAPIVVALLFATSWILVTGPDYDLARWPLWLVSIVTALVVWRTRLHLLWLIGGGGLLGYLGWI